MTQILFSRPIWLDFTWCFLFCSSNQVGPFQSPRVITYIEEIASSKCNHLSQDVTRFTTDLSLPHPPTPGLEVLGVDVPKYVQLGADAALHCSYSSTSPVYSVRWYKGGKEFYSFLPGIINQISFTVPVLNEKMYKTLRY